MDKTNEQPDPMGRRAETAEQSHIRNAKTEKKRNHNFEKIQMKIKV